MSRNLSASALSNEIVGGLVARSEGAQSLITEANGSQFAFAGKSGNWNPTEAYTGQSLQFLRATTPPERKALYPTAFSTLLNGVLSSEAEFVFPPAVAQDGSLLFPAGSGGLGRVATDGLVTRPSTGGNNSSLVFASPNNPNQLISYYPYSGGGQNQAYSVSTDNGVTWANNINFAQTLFSGGSPSNISGITLNTYNRDSRPYTGGFGLRGQHFYSPSANAHWLYSFGARVLRVGTNNSGAAIVASLSADGIANANDDASTVVFGAANLAGADARYFFAHRNGNTGFFTVGNAATVFAAGTRYTTDGGASWTGSTGGPTGAGAFGYRFNGSDPAKLVMLGRNDSIGSRNSAYTTSNTGLTWTLRSLPFSYGGNHDSAAYVGNIGALVNGIDPANRRLYVTTDNFATITLVPTTRGVPNIPGVTGQVVAVFNDSTRVYAFFSSNQIAHTTDGVNWTVRNVSGLMPTFNVDSSLYGTGFAKIGNRSVLAVNTAGDRYAYFTVDNAGTWGVGYVQPNTVQAFGAELVTTLGDQFFVYVGRANSGGGINSIGSLNQALVFRPEFGVDGAAIQPIGSAVNSGGAGSQFPNAQPYLKLS